MKKVLPLAVFPFVILAPQAFGQTDTSLLRLNDYAEYFGFRNGNIAIGNRYVVSVSDDDHNKYGNLGGEYLDTVDTPLE